MANETPSEGQSPFSYVLSDDKTRLKIVLHEAEFVYTPEDVTRLALFFALQRMQMNPPVSDTSQGEATPQADRYEVYQNPLDGSAQIFLRIPGLGWPFVSLDREQCLRMIETLVPRDIPPDVARH